jgi:hypothetical protein
MTLITIDNFSTTLKLSSQGRAGTPDGNFFPNTTTGELELIGVDELATVDFGSGAVANPLNNFDGITAQAIYAFERSIRQTGDEDLRGSRAFSEGVFKFAGAFESVYGRKVAPADVPKIRSSGLQERLGKDGAVNRIYFGVRSLVDIQADTQPFYQLVQKPVNFANRQAAAPVDFSRIGDIDELIQTFGSTANGDATAGDFDFTGYELIVKVWTYGRTFTSATSTASGISELNGFSGGFGVGDGNPTSTANYAIANVYGGAAIAPFTGISYSSQATPQTVAGFSDGSDGTQSADFSDVISNSAGATLEQVRAWMDAAMLDDSDIDQRVGGSFRPKRAQELYRVDGTTIVTRQGLYIENLPAADQRSIRFTDDAGVEQSFPSTGDVRVTVPTTWINDPNGWYQAFTAASYNGADPVTFQDASNVNVSGTSADVVSGEIRFTASEVDLDTDIVFVAEGNGGATFDDVTITLDSSLPIIRATVAPSAEVYLA